MSYLVDLIESLNISHFSMDAIEKWHPFTRIHLPFYLGIQCLSRVICVQWEPGVVVHYERLYHKEVVLTALALAG